MILEEQVRVIRTSGQMKSSFREYAKDVIDEGVAGFERSLRTKDVRSVDICSGLISPLCSDLEDGMERYGVNRHGKRYKQAKGYMNDKLTETMILMAPYLSGSR